jgi:hypothetical protein
MGLSFGKSASSGSNTSQSSLKRGDGVFVNKAVITEASIDYDCAMMEGSKWQDDVALRLKLAQEGLNFEKDLYIGGNFKKEGPPGGEQIANWGSAFKVARVFDVLDIKGDLDSEGHFYKDAIEALPGRTIFFLQYSTKLKDNGKARYADYRIVDAPRSAEEPDDAVADRITAAFEKDLAGNYLKNYRPASELKEEADAALAFDEPNDSAEDAVLDTIWG